MTPNEKCPRFLKCAVNNCPLHPSYPDLPTSPMDAEKKCTIAKSIRVRVASEFPGALRYEGMNTREWGARTVMENPTPRQLENMRNFAKKRAESR